MKKTVAIIIVIILFLIAGIYGLLFTPPGNNILRGVIEKRLKEKGTAGSD